MTQVVLLTGGNLGPVADTLARARRLLIERVGPEWAHSGVRESEPWGFEAPQRFLNQVLVLETELEPLELLDAVQQIERELGRTRETEPQSAGSEPEESQSPRGPLRESNRAGDRPQKAGEKLQSAGSEPEEPQNAAEASPARPETRAYHSRPIDIDILFYGDRIADTPRLNLPHPLIGQRAFVLRPLAEVLPDYIHPVTGLTVREMLGRLECSE